VCAIYDYDRSNADNLGPSLLPPFELAEFKAVNREHTGRIALGVPVWQPGRWRVIPTVSASLSIDTSSLDGGLSIDYSRTGSIFLTTGIGFVYADRIGAMGGVVIPLWNSGNFETAVQGIAVLTIQLVKR
jgi:hypothetical protein